MRNVIKQADKGRSEISNHFPNRDLTAGEMRQLYDLFKKAPSIADGIFDLISNAFYMGFAVGQRSSK